MPENRPARWNICIIRLCYVNYSSKRGKGMNRFH